MASIRKFIACPSGFDVLNGIKLNAEWKAYEPAENPFKDYTTAEVKELLGTHLRKEYSSGIIYDVDASLPESFDARKQWPNCVHSIMNQARCGSCWAFGAAESLSDRFCIASKEKTNVVLSPQELVSCDSNNYGCNGGYLDKAWDFLEAHGTVTEECNSYKSGDGSYHSCPSKCDNGSAPQYYKAKNTVQFRSTSQIKKDIMNYGPVETGFMVYEDFMSYSSGVYRHTSGGFLGGHAVKVVGWGKENGTEYWIVANSWGSNWGEKGFFRIAFGQCGFDDDMLAGQARL